MACPSTPDPAAKRKKVKGAPTTPALVEFAQQLLTDQPAEAARAFVPLVTLFDELLAEADDAGVIRPGLRRFLAGVVLEAIMFNAFSTTIGGVSVRKAEDPAEELWDLILHGVGED